MKFCKVYKDSFGIKVYNILCLCLHSTCPLYKNSLIFVLIIEIKMKFDLVLMNQT
jgi:hypothetical protein